MKTLHRWAAFVALLCLATFWSATVISLLLGDAALAAGVKRGIAWGLLVLVPAMAALGASGYVPARHRMNATLRRKMMRMRIAAANGVLLLVPAALWLAWRASSGRWESPYAAVQALELAAGALNVALIVRNAREGRRLARVPMARAATQAST